MRRLFHGRVLILGLVWMAMGCGSSGTSGLGDDGLTMAFVRFTGEGITQADFVGDTVAQVDICQGLCSSGGLTGEVTFEDFTSTFVVAVFVNRGKADIVLDEYKVFVPESGVPERIGRITARLPGGRCLGADQEQQCADDTDCGILGVCAHTETPVGILLYDFDFKQRVRQGECPFDLTSLTLDADVTFTGSDESGERFTITTNYVSTFDNFDNCEEQ
jgi:hypothetical protein